VTRLPPALAAVATARLLELLPDPPARVLEIGFAGIHAEPLRLAGYEVTVVEPDERYRERARERAGGVLAEIPDQLFDVAVVTKPYPLIRARRVLVVRVDGSIAALD
jgi:hypothetical protein